MRLNRRVPLSKQALAFYSLLLRNESLSAQNIADELNILPNAVYRITRKLMDLGLIEKINSYPVKFQAKSIAEAAKNYGSFSTNLFLENFQRINQNKKPVNSNQPLAISFIKTRSELLERTHEDIKIARKTIDHIVSGMELPAETILSYKKSLGKGVKLRFLVQNLDELNRDMMISWQKMGLEVRHSPILEARIIIFDSEIVYLTSYSLQKKEEAIGIRFAYTPIAKQISDLFERIWQAANPII